MLVRPFLIAACPLLLFAAPALAQPRAGLAEKLEELNVRHQTDHFVLAGTVSDERLEEYGRALEWIYGQYTRGFADLLRDEKRANAAQRRKAAGARRSNVPQRAEQSADSEQTSLADIDADESHRIIIFAERGEYLTFGSQYIRGSEHSIGLFLDSANLLLILDQGDADETYSILFHEAFHQFFHRYVKNPPTWLDEGLATHYGYGRPHGRGFTFSRPPPENWRLVRTLITQRQAIPLWDVVSASRAKFYDMSGVSVQGYMRVTRKNIYYAQAYTLVHALLNDRDGRKHLQKYVRALANDDGQNTRTITAEYFGPDICDRLVDGWVRHVRSNPETR